MPPARRHFCTVVKRGAGGCFAPEKYGFSGCIPAEMKSVEGSSGGGISEAGREAQVALRLEEREEALAELGGRAHADDRSALRRSLRWPVRDELDCAGSAVGEHRLLRPVATSERSRSRRRPGSARPGDRHRVGLRRRLAAAATDRVSASAWRRRRLGRRSSAASGRRRGGPRQGPASRRRAASFAASIASEKLRFLRNDEKPCATPAVKPDTFSTGFEIAVDTARTAVSALSAIETALSVTVSSLSSW